MIADCCRGVRSAWLDNLVKAVLVAPLLKQTSEEQLDRGTMHLQSLEVAAGKTALDARITRSAELEARSPDPRRRARDAPWPGLTYNFRTQ
jgi:hypothetical protein